MIRSALALAALLGVAISSGVAYACPAHFVSTDKQTVASVDGKSSAPVVLPSTGKGG